MSPRAQETTTEAAVRRASVLSSCLLFCLCCLGAWADKPAGPVEPVRLTKDGGFKQHLQWSPDGKRFLLTRIHEGKMALWTMNSDGSDLKPLLPGQATPHFDGHWAPDGKRIVFVFDILSSMSSIASVW